MTERVARVPEPEAATRPAPRGRSARTVVQARLRVGASDDPLEREAERTALAFGRAPTRGAGEIEIGSVGRSGGGVTAGLEARVERIRRSGGHPIAEADRRPLEQYFDRDLSDVRIHRSSAAADVSRAMGAVAFTSGHDIFFDSGRYQPGRAEGNHLLAHEVTHVVQQGGSRIARSSIVRRDATTWQAWAGTALQGETHTFADAGGMIVIDDALDATEAFLTDMLKSEEKLKRVVQTAKALREAKFDVKAMPQEQKGWLTDFQKSANERMRFRAAIGPTPGGTSLVETFITKTVTPAWSPDPLPGFLTAMAPAARGRMYELAKGSKPEPEKLAGLKWAKSQGAATVSELVNFTEYHVERKGDIDLRTAAKANEAFRKKRLSNQLTVIADTDPQIMITAKELGAVVEYNILMKAVGRYIAKATRGTLDANDVAALSTFGVSATEATATLRDAFVAEVKNAAIARVNAPGYDLARYRDEAKLSLQQGLDAAEMQSLTDTASAEVAAEVGAEFRDAGDSVATAGYTGTGPVVAGWAGLGDADRPAAISAVAKKQKKIPFFSASGAAYHAVKHYADLVGTEDAATAEAGKTAAYLASSTKTIAEPTEPVTHQYGQLYDTPSYFFVRTVPAGVGGSSRKMRAIVSVDAAGHVNIATYFQAA